MRVAPVSSYWPRPHKDTKKKAGPINEETVNRRLFNSLFHFLGPERKFLCLSSFWRVLGLRNKRIERRFALALAFTHSELDRPQYIFISFS
jgi:hypothetical protein